MRNETIRAILVAAEEQHPGIFDGVKAGDVPVAVTLSLRRYELRQWHEQERWFKAAYPNGIDPRPWDGLRAPPEQCAENAKCSEDEPTLVEVMERCQEITRKHGLEGKLQLEPRHDPEDARLADELMGFHDAMTPGRQHDGAFRLQLFTGLDSSEMTRGFRAVLREAAARLRGEQLAESAKS